MEAAEETCALDNGAEDDRIWASMRAQVQERPFEGPPNNNEDCLYINVFTPNVDPAAREKLPVMFWSYGGGDSNGESNDYDGSKLASQGHTVVVTFNYRMNLMGFLAPPALDQEGHLFGNYGLLDNQFALKWVHRNIARFGGDPNNVTVFGQSGGARNLGAEVVSPLAAGLFHRAIFESGAIPPETPLSVAETKGTSFAVAAGCGSGTDSATAKCLRSLTAAQVEALAGTVSSDSAYVTGLITDGQILPLPAIDQYATGNFNHVPIIDGDVLNEGNFALAGIEYYESPRAPLTEDQFIAYVTKTYGGNAGPGGPLLVVRPTRHIAMCRSILSENPAYSPFGHGQLTPQLIDASPSPRGAQKFPRAASCKISLSSVRSEIARRSRRFFCSKPFIRRA